MAAHRASSQPVLPLRASAASGGYDLFPDHDIGHGRIATGYPELARRIARLAGGRGRGTVVIDGNAAVDWTRLRHGLGASLAELITGVDWVDAHLGWRREADVDALLAPHLSDDPLFGHRHPGALTDLLDPAPIDAALRAARAQGRRVILAGPAAAALHPPGERDVVVYLDVPKNEVQYRQRAGAARNLGRRTPLEPKRAYKRSYFVDWPLEAAQLGALLPRVDLLVDAQRPDEPTFVAGDTLRTALADLTRGPVRARPWFEPGAWGGQFLRRQIPELPLERNYAWSFELIAPENGLILSSDGVLLEVPFDLLLLADAGAVLGAHADRFGPYFPIRFDYLDTMEGGNLSLQCHPSPAYARQQFGERLAQDETYYIARALPGAEVYLGFRGDVDPHAFRRAVDEAHATGAPLDVRAHVRTLPAHRHDLFLIPHGTIHCAGAGSLVLEISATPYIFTFKIYDWQRLDLDGLPRTINVERAFANLRFEHAGEFVDHSLVSVPRVLDTGPTHRTVHLPTHGDHFYDVHRLDLEGPTEQTVHGGVHVMNVVEGAGARVTTASGVTRTYREAETFIVPAAARAYVIEPLDGPAKVVKAFLKE